MPTARAVAGEATALYPGLAVRIATGDPLDTLVDRMRPLAARAVDALQVAAALESAGVTDHTARARYGFADVFALAEVVHQRVPPAPEAVAHPRSRGWGTVSGWRDIGHGAMYLIAVPLFPPAMAALGRSASITALVLTAATGWVLSGVSSWLAHRLIGDGQAGLAGRLLGWTTLVAIPLGAAVGASVVAVTDAGPGLVALTAGAMAYQLAVTVLVIHGHEALVFAAMTPGVAAGVAYLVAGPPLLSLAISAGLGSVTVAVGLALYEAFGRARREAFGGFRREASGRVPQPASGDRPGPVGLTGALRQHRRRILTVLVFSALSAAFFLHPQARHLATRLDIALATLPLIAGMGVVEWRARRFADQARIVLTRVTHPRQFAVRIWLVVLGGLGICLAVVGALAAVVLGLLTVTGRGSAPAAVMATTGVLLAGAYYLGFLLANQGRYGWLCVSLVLSLASYEIARFALSGVLGDIQAFQIAAAQLLLLSAAGLLGFLTQARHHR
jgi:hypothetical protein